MKHAYIGLLLLIAIVSGCQKKGDDLSNSSSDLATPKSVPAFNISNKVSDNSVMEGRNLKIQDMSQHAFSYHWDFGNGIIFDGKTPPADIYYIPCGKTITISLTTKNLVGETSTCSKTFYIFCSGKMTCGTHLTD